MGTGLQRSTDRVRLNVCLLCLLAGCRASAPRQGLATEAPDPADRIRAIVAIVEQPDQDKRSATAVLVDRLDDEDEGVRWFAIAALDRVTGRRLGFEASAPVEQRRLAVDRWRRYLVEMDLPAVEGCP